jgi:hypothetical protein
MWPIFQPGVGFLTTIGYTGIEPGIKDPKVFDKPKECSSVLEEVKKNKFRKKDNMITETEGQCVIFKK